MEVVLCIVSLLVGGAAGWLAGVWRTQARTAGSESGLRQELGGAQSTIAELRRQLDEANASRARADAECRALATERAAAETKLAESSKALEAQRQFLADAEKALKDAFAALSTQALRGNSEEFARQVLDKTTPLAEQLRRYEEELKRIEEARQKAYGSLGEQLRALATRSDELGQKAGSLAEALRSPTVKGRWGELALRRAAEAAGMSKYCDFSLQESVDTEGGKLRPDMIVRLPGGRVVVVDAKTPTGDYLAAVEASTPEQRGACLDRHARATRQHLQNLAGKEYWRQFEQAPEFVVMYVPGEAFFSAALERDETLIEDGFAKGVAIASPTTFIALLRGVAAGWQQHAIVENSRAIHETARELYDRMLTFVEHLAGIRAGLSSASDAFDKAVGSWERRVRPMAGRLNELGVGGDGGAAELEPLHAELRRAPEPSAGLFSADKPP